MKTSGPVIVAALLAATVTAASYGGISGGGGLVNGISGGGGLVNGISGGGGLVNGISGGGGLVNGISGGGAPQLLVVGPVEAINAANSTAIVLGQMVHAASLERLAVSNTVAFTERHAPMEVSRRPQSNLGAFTCLAQHPSLSRGLCKRLNLLLAV